MLDVLCSVAFEILLAVVNHCITMLGYISSTRKKSCQGCVKSKRRCDLGYPICKRCLTKGLHCKYPNASVREAEVVVRQATPDLLPLTEVVNEPIEVPLEATNIDPSLSENTSSSSSGSSSGLSSGSSSDSSSSPEAIVPDDLSHTILESILPQIWEPRILGEAQVSLIVNELCAFVPSLAYSGTTFFINDNLYQNWQPSAYQDACGIAALYMVKTPRNAAVLTSSINAKVSTLISTYNSWTLDEHLAAVQALIIYQIIRIFDPSLNQQALGERQIHLLELWTATLWKRSFNEPDHGMSTFSSWVFQESLRRTVLMSVFFRGAWSALTRNGLCDQIPVLARLPLTRDVRLFECSEDEWSKPNPRQQGAKGLISYGDLSLAWIPDRSVDDLPPFERLLLAACHGDRDPRLLF